MPLSRKNIVIAKDDPCTPESNKIRSVPDSTEYYMKNYPSAYNAKTERRTFNEGKPKYTKVIK
jgi:hypothetical protein